MKFSWQALVTKLAGGALIGLAPILAAYFPHQATLFQAIFGSTGVVVLIAGMFVQSSQPAAKIVENAPVVSATTGAPTGATNISSTSSLLKGP